MAELPTTNKKIVLRKRPGQLIAPDDTAIETSSVPEPGDGEALIKTEFLAMDPVTRVIINEDIGLVPPIELGQALRSFGGGVVVKSRSEDLPVGALVTGFFEWATWQVIATSPRTHVLPANVSLESGLNVYGHTAMAAYFGLLELGKPKQGETVLVSGAAGAVGTVAGQLARIAGARVIGIAGGDEKCRWLTDTLGFDAAIDYKAPNWTQKLKQLAPTGIDLYFDNVGGELLDSVLPLIHSSGRVVCCGSSAQYTSSKPLAPPENPNNVPLLRFNAMDNAAQFEAAAKRMLAWQRTDGLQFPYTVIEGLAQAPDALNRLFDGRSRGRLLVKVG